MSPPPDTKETKELKKTYDSLSPSQKSKYDKLSDESKILFLKMIRKGKRLNDIVVIFTLLGGINIENLNLLELDLLNTNTKLSPSSRSNIMWGTITNTFIEKIPQIIILVCKFFFTLPFSYSIKLNIKFILLINNRAFI